MSEKSRPGVACYRKDGWTLEVWSEFDEQLGYECLVARLTGTVDIDVSAGDSDVYECLDEVLDGLRDELGDQMPWDDFLHEVERDEHESIIATTHGGGDE